MKKLMRVRLINWHRFENETIDFSGSTLLSGENGAGKSTILDAIQFVLTCSKANFNKAAHDKGKRTLNSYMRCKTGREDRPFERTGPLSAHIALEFYDEARKQAFVIGVVMDSASEEKEPGSSWYLMEKRELSDDLFFAGQRVKSISKFRNTNRGISKWCVTQAEAKNMMQARFGRLEDKFFSLIPKALAFRPIQDIKDFVYSYVLDEKEVNIDALRENVRSYQDLERMLADVRRRIDSLEAIRDKHGEVQRYMNNLRTDDYFIARAVFDMTEQQILECGKLMESCRLQAELLSRQLEENGNLIQTKEDTIRNLQVELDSNEDYRAIEAAEKQKEDLDKALKADLLVRKRLEKAAAAARKEAELLRSLEMMPETEPACDGSDMKSLEDYIEKLAHLAEEGSEPETILCLRQFVDYKNRRFRETLHLLAELEYKLREKQQEMAEVKKRIRQLEEKKLVYKQEVLILKAAIEEQLRQTGKAGEVRILCELLEITDGTWQNAVEGYLNTQRFYLITPPDVFDLALSVYNRLRAKKKLYGVGLVNTGKLAGFDQAPEGSLAACVTSRDIWAKRYVNMILGKVHCCEKAEELKNYNISITPQCMRYQNHVAQAIHPSVYSTPYIGAGAYKVQLEQARQALKELEAEETGLEVRQKHWAAYEKPLSTELERQIEGDLPVLAEEKAHRQAMEIVKAELKRLKANRTLIEKTMQIEELKKEKLELSREHDRINQKIGSISAQAESAEARREELKAKQAGNAETMDSLSRALQDEDMDLEKEYLKATDGKNLEIFLQNRQRARLGHETLRANALELLRSLMRKYQADHNFGAADSLEGYAEYAAEYDKLKNSQLLEYEDKVVRARTAAEEEFREQFLSKLQENIKQAQAEFRELNDALADIHFSHETYDFRFEPRKGLKKYYEMIMDDFNVMDGNSIFSSVFSSNHREVIEELFEKLALDDENSARTLQEYTDYRTYMDYDIRITLDDGSYMLYSKVSREKSGGETQTPFYITVAASFMQMYKNSIGGDSIGIIMMDEAFNNMDDERIRGVLAFMNQANLQTIIAAPPDKIQYIGPSMEKTLLVLTDHETSYVEDFTREL